MTIGLTGRSCSGKDAFARMMGDEFVVIDEDALGHEALIQEKDKLTRTFGEEILTEGEVDRKKLGRIVFSSPEMLQKLEGISHPWMIEETLQRCRKAEEEGKIPVINAAILEKMGFVEHCSEVVLVLSSYENRLRRAMKRDNITEEAFLKRSLSQREIGSTLFSCGKKVTTILNDGDEDSLSRQVKAYCDNILGKRAL